MSYSDYGGYAYKNRERIDSRSDCCLVGDQLFSTPGMYPGFAMSEEDRSGVVGRGHAVLGDEGVIVTLYKQSYMEIFDGFAQVPILDILANRTEESSWTYTDNNTGETREYFNDDYYKSEGTPAIFKIKDHTITAYFEIDDNHYMYVQVEQPNGDVWHGFSGYGVGMGLEDCGYGFSTEDRVERLFQLFPERTLEEVNA